MALIANVDFHTKFYQVCIFFPISLDWERINILISQIQELESRQKMLVLLEICGKTDNEITRLLTQAKGREKQDMFIPERIKDYIRRDEVRKKDLGR